MNKPKAITDAVYRLMTTDLSEYSPADKHLDPELQRMGKNMERQQVENERIRSVDYPTIVAWARAEYFGWWDAHPDKLTTAQETEHKALLHCLEGHINAVEQRERYQGLDRREEDELKDMAWTWKPDDEDLH